MMRLAPHMVRAWRRLAFPVMACFSPLCDAHAFASPYTLPIPFWLYAYGSAVALLISFAVFAAFSTPRFSSDLLPGEASEKSQCRKWAAWEPLVVTLNLSSVLILVVTILCGFFGSPNAMLNFNMTWFWIIFLLLFFYASAIVGDFYQFANPWTTSIVAVGRLFKADFDGHVRYPKRLGYFPALFAYFLLIAFELFGNGNPGKLSIFLLLYAFWIFGGAWLFGRTAWLRYADAFGVMFSIVGALAPVEWTANERGRWHVRLRLPLSGFSACRQTSISLTCFVVFMLSSTAFDGIHDTLLWNSGYWREVFPLLRVVIESNSSYIGARAAQLYYAWQWLSLALSPLLYLAAYGLVLAAGKLLVGSQLSYRQLISDFSWSLVPIAFFYNITHYFTVALSQSPQIIKLASDPLGKQWDLFGTATKNIQPLLLDAGVVWHAQVALILMGHILGVYLAHGQSFRSFRTRSSAIVSQVPMVVLMVMLTASGLWILSLPMNSA